MLTYGPPCHLYLVFVAVLMLGVSCRYQLRLQSAEGTYMALFQTTTTTTAPAPLYWPEKLQSQQAEQVSFLEVNEEGANASNASNASSNLPSTKELSNLLGLHNMQFVASGSHLPPALHNMPAPPHNPLFAQPEQAKSLEHFNQQVSTMIHSGDNAELQKSPFQKA